MTDGNTPPSAIKDLARLRDPDLGLMASTGPHFSHAVFGRDSLEAAEDLLDIDPQLGRDVIRTLAALQGTAEAPSGPDSNEEEPGKIHHEFRSLELSGERPSPAALARLKKEATQWGGSDDSVVYYGTADATPLYIRLIARFCEQYGGDLLAKRYTDKTGKTCTIATSVQRALLWVCRRVEESDLGILEYRRRNPQGIENQTWKDSQTAFVHLDGTIPDWSRPFATIELQGLAYDALTYGGRLLAAKHERLRQRSAALAQSLRDATLAHFWMPDERYFAAAIDRRPDGSPRQVQTLVSNPGLLLDSRLFDELPLRSRREYIGGIVEHLFSSDFLTDAGIRCRALRHLKLVPFHDYHGVCSVWPKDTFDIAKGLRRQGFIKLAAELEERLLQTVNRAGGHFEFFYVSPQGKVEYRSAPKLQSKAQTRVIVGTNVPQPRQAWTVSAALAIKVGRTTSSNSVPPPHWVLQLQRSILRRIPRRQVEKHVSLPGRRQPVRIDRVSGRALERKILRERQPGQ